MTVRKPPPSYVRSEPGWLYLICFDSPLGHASHYLGWTQDLPERIRCHRRGNGAKIMAAVRRAGITWQVVGVRPGTPMLEYTLKYRGGLARCCPRCGGRHGTGLKDSPWQEPPPEVLEVLAA